MKPKANWVAIAAMSENRVIGDQGQIPWHFSEDFKWFKEVTMGGILVMGRKTYESIGRPLPGRETWVLSRHQGTDDRVRWFPSFEQIPDSSDDGRRIFICGGGEIYQAVLEQCSELWLTRVFGHFEGDAFFPPFESFMDFVDQPLETADFQVCRYRHRELGSELAT